MSYSIKSLYAAALAAVCIVSSVTTTATASMQLSLDTGSGFQLLASGPSGTNVVALNGSQDNVSFFILSGSSNSPGVAPQSQLNISSLLLTNNNAFDVTVRILVGDTDFTYPGVGPVSLASGLGGTVSDRTVKSVSYQTWIDPNNVQDSMVGSITSGVLSQDTSAVNNGQPFEPLGNSVSGVLGSSPFSMTGLVTIVLGAGASANFATTAVAAVPEASTIAVWSVLGLVGAGFGYRKRMIKA